MEAAAGRAEAALASCGGLPLLTCTPPWEPGVRGLWAEVRPETDVIFQLREHSIHTLTHTDMHARILTHPHIRTHACTYVHIHAHSHTYTHACTHTDSHTHDTHTLDLTRIFLCPFPYGPPPTEGIHLALRWQPQSFAPSGNTSGEAPCQAGGEDSQGQRRRGEKTRQLPGSSRRGLFTPPQIPQPRNWPTQPPTAAWTACRASNFLCSAHPPLLRHSTTGTHSGDI